MRAELLKKEKELIQLRQQQIDDQIKKEKEKMMQVKYDIVIKVQIVRTIFNEIKIDSLSVSNVNVYKSQGLM